MDRQGAAPNSIPPAVITAALNRIIASDVFRSSPQLAAFLRFVVETSLRGKAERIKAYTIGTDALGRRGSFDPQADPIVRVEAARLRRAIKRYYAGAGATDPIVIELPRRGYVPVFRRRRVDQELPVAHAPQDTTFPTMKHDPSRGGVAAAGDNRVRPNGVSESAMPVLPNKPSIAVMAFRNMSGDPEQEYFADGMVEDIIAALSRTRWLFVIARDSTFTYKGRAVDVKRVGRELGVHYVLQGSVRKSGNRLRINGQLIDASNGVHLWADRFESALGDIFDLQDQFTTSIVCAIVPKLEQAGIAHAARKPTKSLDAYDYFLRGMASFHRWTRKDVEAALGLFCQAVDLDPDFAAPYGAAAQCYANRKANGYITDWAQEIAEAGRVAGRAVTLGRDDAFALSSGGNALAYVLGDVELGAVLIDRALALDPNLAAAWYYGAWVKMFLGEPDLALECLARALRLSPLDPRIGLMQTAKAFAHFFAGRDEEASSWADRAVREMPDFVPARYISAASNALAGRLADARRAITLARAFDPGRRVSDLKREMPLRRPQDYARLAEGLVMAGLPK
jgi:TolB-like protein